MAVREKQTKKEKANLRRKIRQQTVGYILAAFGLVAGLAWNEAIRSFIDYFVPFSGNTLVVKFTYAVMVTLLVVIVSNYLSRLIEEG